MDSNDGSLFDDGGKDLLHEQVGGAARRRNELVATVGPNRMRHSSKRNQSFVVAVLVAVIDPRTRKQAATIVLV